MKNLSIVVVFVLLGVGAVGLFGQETPKPYRYTSGANFNDCVFTGATMGQVRAAMKKAFMTQDTKNRGPWSDKAVADEFSEKPGFIHGAWLMGHGRKTRDWTCWINVEETAEGIRIYQGIREIHSDTDDGPTELWLKVWPEFCERVAELLYGKGENKEERAWRDSNPRPAA